MSKVEMSSYLGHGNHAAIEFEISVVRKKSASKTSALDTGRTNFRLLRVLVSKVPWEITVEGAKLHQCWSLFKGTS